MLITQRKDSVIFALVLIILIIEVACLLTQLRLISIPFFLERTGSSSHPIGELLHRGLDVKSRSESSLSWYPMQGGDGIFEGDTLMTGPLSRAEVQVNTGALEIGPESLVTFSSPATSSVARPLILDMEKGTIQIQAAKTPITFHLKTRSIRLEADSNVQIVRDGTSSSLKIQVKKGEIHVARTGVAPIPMTEGQFAEWKVGESVDEKASQSPVAPKRREASAIQIESPKAGDRITLNSFNEKVRFSWKGLAKRLEISEATDFAQSAVLTTDEVSVETELRPGRYYWRLFSDEAQSESSEFVILPPVHYRLLKPQAGAKLKSAAPVRFEWESIDDAKSYHIIVARNAAMTEAICHEVVQPTHFECALPMGQYYWSIQANHKTLGHWGTSPVYSFYLKRPLPSPKPKPQSLFDKLQHFAKFISELVLPVAYAQSPSSSAELDVEWDPIEGAQSYRLEVSDSPAFKIVTYSQEITKTHGSIPLRKSVIYWRVAGRDEDGDLGFFCEPQKVEASPSRTVALLPASPKEPTEPLKMPPPKVNIERAPVIPLDTTNWVRLGLHGSYRKLRTTSSTLALTDQGLAMGWQVEVHRGFSNCEIQVRGEYLKRKLLPEDGLPTDIQGSFSSQLWSTETLVIGNWLEELLMSGGLEISSLNYFQRTGSESVEMLTKVWGAILLGPHHRINWKSIRLRQEILFAGAPVGTVRGYGVRYRAGVGTLLGRFTAELRLSFAIDWRTVAAENQKDLAWNADTGLAIGF